MKLMIKCTTRKEDIYLSWFLFRISTMTNEEDSGFIRLPVCSACKESFEVQSVLQIHYFLSHEAKLFICEFCHESFRLEHDLYEHELAHVAALDKLEKLKYTRIQIERFDRCKYHNHPVIEKHEVEHMTEVSPKSEVSFRKVEAEDRLNSLEFAAMEELVEKLKSTRIGIERFDRCKYHNHPVTEKHKEQHITEVSSKSEVSFSKVKTEDCLNSREFKRHSCNECEKIFFSKRLLDRHKVCHCSENSHKIYSTSNEIFKSEDYLENRKLVNNKEVSEIDVCKKIYARKNKLRKHKPVQNKKLHECDFCNKGFRRKAHLVRHESVHGDKRSQKGYSDIFKKEDSLENKLRTHKLVQNAKKLHECDFCNKSFRRKAHLVRHESVHGDKRSQKGYREIFKKEDSLETYKLAHTDKVYDCNICKKSYKRKDHLHRHKLIHSDVVHECNMCEMSFKRKDHLDRHKLTHSDVVHECNMCEMSFKRKDHLNRHRLTHTRNKSHKCDFCDGSFYRKDHLVKHKQSSHGGKRSHKNKRTLKSFL